MEEILHTACLPLIYPIQHTTGVVTIWALHLISLAFHTPSHTVVPYHTWQHSVTDGQDWKPADWVTCTVSVPLCRTACTCCMPTMLHLLPLHTLHENFWHAVCCTLYVWGISAYHYLFALHSGLCSLYISLLLLPLWFVLYPIIPFIATCVTFSVSQIPGPFLIFPHCVTFLYLPNDISKHYSFSLSLSVFFVLEHYWRQTLLVLLPACALSLFVPWVWFD